MADSERQDKLFGDIAIEKQMVTSDKLERALVIQRCIVNRTKVYMPIGAVLQKMGLVTEAQVEEVLSIQRGTFQETPAPEPSQHSAESESGGTGSLTAITLAVSSDKLTATIIPMKAGQAPPPLDVIKLMLMEKEIAFGVVSDTLLIAYLSKNPMPAEPFVVARGTSPVAGQPPEIRYYFDTNPLRIGTLLEDGTMDWKNRGDIPQVNVGDLLAEKVGGAPGKLGMSVFGLEIPAPRVKEPPLKFSRGAERSEDGRQILAKIKGTPKLGTDGRIGVFGVLPIDSDIGLETGNIEFDGHIEVNGGIDNGYKVKGGSLSIKEIQNAEIDLADDLVSNGGIYGSTLLVGGHLKASHIHNSTLEVLGDLVVEKEIFGCTILITGRCMIDSGKIIASKITAKKGILVKDIGTQAARPSELIVGVDFKFERDMNALKEQMADLERRKAEAANAIIALKGQIDKMDAELGRVAQEQDGCMVQKRQLEEKLKGPEISKNAAQEQIGLLEEAAKVDPGIPVVKASGIVFAKTFVAGPHRKILIPEDMHNVRIAESQEDPKQYQMKISSLR
ncbi:MAG: DUF342 domain-containing protein [Desulfobacterales bacterium]|nr:DUF342 domain-containing protein [Desulfobacterales bacterium]